MGDLKQQTGRIDPDGKTEYVFHWFNARYLLHSGKLEEAITEYQFAFERVIYKQARNTKKIVNEAMVAACRSQKPNKTFINRLRRMAVILGFDFMPPEHNADEFKAKPQEIETWEISAFSHQFSAYFPKATFFPGAIYPENPHQDYGPWFMDRVISTPDLKRPNKILNIGADGGMVKSMPQLVYFSKVGNIDAVQKLLDAGADVNKLSSVHESALLFAIQCLQVTLEPLGSMDDALFKLLSQYEHRKSVLDTLTDKRKLSPLGCAIETGNIEIVSKVLDLGASVDRRQDIDGLTPLYSAIHMIGNYFTRRPTPAKVLEMMMGSESGINVMRANSAGLLPHSKDDLCHLFEAMISDPRHKQIFDYLWNEQFKTIQQYTKADDFRQLAKLLIQRGADPNAKHNIALEDYTPLMLAVELDELELVKAMMQSEHHPADLEATCWARDVNLRAGLFEIACKWDSKNILHDLYPTFLHKLNN